MFSTFSVDKAVQRAEIVQPATLNERSLAALDAGMANSCLANVRNLGKVLDCSFHQLRMSGESDVVLVSR